MPLILGTDSVLVLIVNCYYCYLLFSPLSCQFDDAAHLVGNADLLRAFADTLTAINAGGGALLSRYCRTVGFDESILLVGIILGSRLWQRQHLVGNGLVVEGEVARDIHSVGARHTITAGGATYGWEACHLVGYA